MNQYCRVDAVGKGVGGVKFAADDPGLWIARQEDFGIFFIVIDARELSEGCFVDRGDG
jgi:hypothetical protein